MRGRKPKPTALKILDGTQKCRINRSEPAIPPGSIDPPDWLDEVARKHWSELAPILHGAGILTSADRHALALLCESFSRFRADPLEDKARDLYRRLSVEFGLTPSSRSRLKAPVEGPKDALGEFLSKKKG
jgi:phage terminase small subunit